jgi:hypothetical protein
MKQKTNKQTKQGTKAQKTRGENIADVIGCM